MKFIVVFALFVAIATATSYGDREFHLHLNLKNTASNFVVRNLISRYIDQVAHQTNQNDIGLHLHVDDMTEEELELFGFGDIIKGIKKGAEVVGKGVQKGVQEVGKGIQKGVKEVGKGINKGVQEIGKGFNIVGQGINIAIKQTEKAFNNVKRDIEKIILPKINIPKLIQPIINIAKLVVKLIPCGMALKKAAPAFFSFAKAAVAGSAAGAVQSLMSMLQYMPEITEKCVGRAFKIPPNIMSKVQCAADIVGLAAIVGQLILAPEHVIATVNSIVSLVDLIPRTISDCTGAFK